MKHLSAYASISTLGLAIACVPQGEIRVDANRGKKLFEQNCAVCHGPRARGDVASSNTLNKSPPDLTILSRKNSGEFPRDYVMAIIDGLDRHDSGTHSMPEFGATDLGPIIIVEHDGIGTPVPADLLALAEYLELIQR